jgi:hypothetical protein
MPQPAFEVQKYLSKPLPQIREQYPPGTGGTGPRASWEGSLKGVEVIDDLNERVTKCMSIVFLQDGSRLMVDFEEQVPKEPIQPHPQHKYPKIVQVISKLPSVIKSPSDLQTCMSVSRVNMIKAD